MNRRALLGALSALATSRAVTAVEPDELLGPFMPYRQFGDMPTTDLRVGPTTLQVAFVPSTGTAAEYASLLAWIDNAAGIVARYMQRFPVDAIKVLVVRRPGAAIHGSTWGFRGAATRILLGENVTVAERQRDWVLVHEFVHITTPQMDDRHNWLTEGLATYVEPIARAQAGQLTDAEVWGDFFRDMRKGQPAAGDRGLDRTPTWARTYWGGALFCLVADVQIRERTGNRFGLQDALRGLVRAGASNEVDWPIEKFFATADRAATVPVLAELYAAHREKAVTIDLDNLWQRLGVRPSASGVAFNDETPLAAVRRSITRAIPAA